jgi:hypothetical protein
MNDIRWLEIPAGEFDGFKHPSGLFIERGPYSVYRVLQVRFDDEDGWHDVPVTEAQR